MFSELEVPDEEITLCNGAFSRDGNKGSWTLVVRRQTPCRYTHRKSGDAAMNASSSVKIFLVPFPRGIIEINEKHFRMQNISAYISQTRKKSTPYIKLTSHSGQNQSPSGSAVSFRHLAW